MAITQQQVQEACANIERSLETFRADPQKVDQLGGALAAQQWLREQYRTNKDLLEPHVDRLRDLGRAICDCLRAAREALTEEYLRAMDAENAWKSRRQTCRDALIELARADNVEHFESSSGRIDLKQVRSMTLPKAGTPQREELAGLIRDSGRWEDVTAPNAARLLKALDEGLFTPEQAARLALLCRVGTSFRLMGRLNR